MTFDELRRDESSTTEHYDPFNYKRTTVCKYCEEPLVTHARRATEPNRDELRELRDRVAQLEARVRALEPPPPPYMAPPPSYAAPSAPPKHL